MTRHLTFWKAFGGAVVPKHHYAWHIIERAEIREILDFIGHTLTNPKIEK